MDTRGRHLLAEYTGCEAGLLDSVERVEALMRRAAEASRATVVASVFHPFSPQGVSGVVVIEESHLSIHTWPEYGYAAVDFFTCGECSPEQAHEVLKRGLGAREVELMLVDRGRCSVGGRMDVRYHVRPRQDLGAPPKSLRRPRSTTAAHAQS
ncbi:MAG: adenosylmethionine decarboxylase [Proteobacteria bacterium]|nr:adenosylmethionine decarboxylase [Pseudomonadota bacterium]